MVSNTCPHAGDPHSCPPCHAEVRPLDTAEVPSRPFIATYSGPECPGCGWDITVGENVLYAPEGLTHAGCTDG